MDDDVNDVCATATALGTGHSAECGTTDFLFYGFGNFRGTPRFATAEQGPQGVGRHASYQEAYQVSLAYFVFISLLCGSAFSATQLVCRSLPLSFALLLLRPPPPLSLMYTTAPEPEDRPVCARLIQVRKFEEVCSGFQNLFSLNLIIWQRARTFVHSVPLPLPFRDQ